MTPLFSMFSLSRHEHEHRQGGQKRLKLTRPSCIAWSLSEWPIGAAIANANHTAHVAPEFSVPVRVGTQRRNSRRRL